MPNHRKALVIYTLLLGMLGMSVPSNFLEVICIGNDGRYIEVKDEAASDAVLLLKVNANDVNFDHEFYLKVNSSYTQVASSPVIGSCAVSCGGNGTCVESLNWNVTDTGAISVNVWYSWDTEKSSGKIVNTIEVPWLGESTKDLGNGASARLSFRRPHRELRNEVPVTDVPKR